MDKKLYRGGTKMIQKIYWILSVLVMISLLIQSLYLIHVVYKSEKELKIFRKRQQEMLDEYAKQLEDRKKDEQRRVERV